MITQDLTGPWTGIIVYGKESEKFRDKELYFDAVINQEDEQISGTAIDIGGAGQSPDPATIKGVFVDRKIDFIKQYASYRYNYKGESKIDKSRLGHKIHYTGTYNDTEQTFSGDWVIKAKVWLLGIIPFAYKNTGTWTMRRK